MIRQAGLHFAAIGLILFTESKETAEYLAGKIRDEVEPKTLLFTGGSLTSLYEAAMAM